MKYIAHIAVPNLRKRNMKRNDPLKGFEVFTNRLRRFKREKTTRGILHYIRKHQNETMPVSEFGNDEFMETMEKIFRYVSEPKMICCVWCHEWVTPPDNCSCGKIQYVYKKIGEICK